MKWFTPKLQNSSNLIILEKCKAPLSGYKLIVLIVTITKTNNNIQINKLVALIPN